MSRVSRRINSNIKLKLISTQKFQKTGESFRRLIRAALCSEIQNSFLNMQFTSPHNTANFEHKTSIQRRKLFLTSPVIVAALGTYLCKLRPSVLDSFLPSSPFRIAYVMFQNSSRFKSHSSELRVTRTILSRLLTARFPTLAFVSTMHQTSRVTIRTQHGRSSEN